MKTFVLLIATCAIWAYALNLDEVSPPESRIINGDEARITDFPHQVALFIIGTSKVSGFRCGGALISEKHVLTAAHCFDNTIKAGYSWVGATRFSQGVFREFNRVDVHSGWDPNTNQNDIAIVYLDTPVKQDGDTIRVIPLDRTPVGTNVRLHVSGYGWVDDNLGTDTLYYTSLTSISKQECSVYSSEIIDGMLCAIDKDGKGRATCKGDSGGPIVRNWPQRPTHVGIVSFGPKGSCHYHYPLVFTRTSEYIDWIEARMT